MSTQKSLLRRLLWSFGLTLALSWLLLLALVLWSAWSNGGAAIRHDLRITATQMLAGLNPISHSQASMIDLLEELERLNNEDAAQSGSKTRMYISLWQQGRPVRAADPVAPASPPPPGERDTPALNSIGWSASDAATGLVLLVELRPAGNFSLHAGDVGWFVLPLLLCLPLLVLPAWWVLRRAVLPINHLSTVIGARSAQNLQDVPDAPYLELKPIVQSVNALLGRVRDHHSREQSFLVDAAHELKTPLAIVQVHADRLSSAVDDATRTDSLTGIRQGVARASHAIHQLISLARSSGDFRTPTPMDIAGLIRERLAAFGVIAHSRGIEISLEAADGTATVDRESFAALFDNLVDNAIKYSPRGGLVDIDMGRTPEGLRISITDQGPGIPLELRARVFERFYRIPGTDVPGTGLGLPIVQRAAELNGIVVTLDAGREGKGLGPHASRLSRSLTRSARSAC